MKNKIMYRTCSSPPFQEAVQNGRKSATPVKAGKNILKTNNIIKSATL